MPKKDQLYKGFLILLMVAVLTGTIRYFTLSPEQREKFLASTITGPAGNQGTPGDGWSPLESLIPCTDTGESLLEVSGGGGSYDWNVQPSGFKILSNPTTGSRGDNFIAASAKMKVVSPQTDDFSTVPKHFTVNVVPNGGSSGETFEISIAPACVEKLYFIKPDPSRAIAPTSGRVDIEEIKAQLTNGVTYTYNSSQFSGIEIQFEKDGVIGAASSIQIPNEHPAIAIDMLTDGPNVIPIHVDGQVKAYTVGNLITLDDNRVYSDSVQIYDAGDFILNAGVHYKFVDNGGTGGADAIQIISPSVTDQNLKISYDYTDSNKEVRAELPLGIPATSCNQLQAGIFQGRGQGFYSGPGLTTSTGSRSKLFDFTTAPNTLVITNPISQGNTFGSQVFELRFDFEAGLQKQADLGQTSGTNYIIKVRKETDTKATASNFAFAINNTLGSVSPFIAYVDADNLSAVRLYSVEVGDHTNGYTCSVNGTSVLACFAGGATAGTPQDIDPPRPLDNTLSVGENRTIYIRGGIGTTTWRTSNDRILDVEVLSSKTDEEQLGNENVLFSAVMQSTDFDLPSSYISATKCTEDEDHVLVSCDVKVEAPVVFHFPSAGYPITILPKTGDPIQGRIQGGTMTGTLKGTATLDVNTGGVVQVLGTFTGDVTGHAIGSVKADVSMQVKVDPNFTPANVQLKSQITALTGTLTKDASLVPTQRTTAASGPLVSTFAILSGKSEGRATIFASDSTGCTVPIEIEVKQPKLEIGISVEAQAQIVEVGDTTQVIAKIQDKDVTNLVEWTSSNPEVAKVDRTGLVTAVSSGTTNLTASYETTGEDGSKITSEGRVTIRVEELKDITLSLDTESLAKISETDRLNAYKTVVVAVNRSSAAGKTITVEGTTFNIDLPAGTYSNEVDRVTAMANSLLAKINGTPATFGVVNAVKSPTLAGVLVLSPKAANVNGSIDIASTALADELSLVTGIQSISLPPNESYGLIAVGEYTSGRTQKLNIRDLKFVVDPVNRLDDTALLAGRLEQGDKPGNSALFGEFTTPTNKVVRSNTLTVTVSEGPYIDFVRLLGAGAISQGSRVDLRVRVSQIASIADIKDMKVWIVRSAFDNYQQIASDKNAVWFSVQTFPTEIKEEPATTGTGTTTTPPTSFIDSFIFKAFAEELSYKIFSFPVEIPKDALLTDGSYKLLLELTDVQGHVTRYVFPVNIGKAATGDVNGDGKITMLDVIISFQIANKTIVSPTPTQVQAADLDGRGGVTMVDVLLLFRKAIGA